MGRFFERLDVVEQARLLQTIEAASERLGLGVFVIRVDVVPARFVYVSDQVAELTRRSPDQLVGVTPWEFLPAAGRERMRTLIESREGEAPPLFLEFEIERADGTRVPVEIGVARLQTAAGLLAVGYFRDVRERVEAVEALRRSEARFRSLVENAPDGVVILRGKRISFMNSTAVRLLDLATAADGIGRDIGSFLLPEDARAAGERIGTMLRDGREYPPSEYHTLSGERTVEIKSILVEHEGAPAVLAFARDVTERKALQRELLRADRLAAVGTLAAGVAHEINNPLTYAQLSLQFVERELAHSGLPPERLQSITEHVRNARHGTERVATIVRDLRTFARAEDAPPGPTDVVAVVERAVKIAENDLRHRARLVRRYDDVPAVDGNPSRLEQVFLNLVINAIQALPEGDPSRDEIAIDIHREGDGEIAVTISDTGAGIPPHLRDRVFDPFFTTKPVGEGTGLGLSVCRSILESLGGRISLDSETGRGTRVKVVLRAYRYGSDVLVGASTAAAPVPEVPARRYRVLVVDDEALVRRILAMVAGQQHDVDTAETGEQALAMLDAERYDVVLCDLMMPGTSGMDVYEHVRARHPGFERRIVFVTGGAFVPRLADFLDSVDNVKLLKPFDVEQVLAAVQAAAER